MSFRLKAAYAVAVALFAVAAFTATDPSLASGTNDIVTATSVSSTGLSISDRDMNASSATADSVSIVHNADGSVTVTPRTAKEAAFPSSASTLAELVEEQAIPTDLSPEMQCLAGAVYFESKGESLAGQLAVARVVINRARSGRFPSDLCGVVQQPSQFSFVKDGRMPQAKTSSRDWREAVAIAQIALNDAWNSEVEGALYFHARRVSPGWNRTRMAAIDNHIFYR